MTATQRLIDACFRDDDQRDYIAASLADYSGCEQDQKYPPGDRIVFSIVRVIFERKSFDVVDQIIDMTRRDWRDLLMEAGHGEDCEAHNKWAAGMLREKPRVHLEVSEMIHVQIDPSGRIYCPVCKLNFRPTSKNEWDGKRHLRCWRRMTVDGGASAGAYQSKAMIS